LFIITEKSISPNYLFVGHPISPIMWWLREMWKHNYSIAISACIAWNQSFYGIHNRVPKSRIHKLKLHGQ